MKKQLVYLVGIVLTIFDILFLSYITFYPVDTSFKVNVIIFDLLLCAVFWIEFLYSLKKSDDRKEYLKNNSLSILGMLPFNSVFMRLLRFVKLAQLIKIFILIRDDEKIFADFLKKTYLDKIIAITIVFIVIVTILVWQVDSNIIDFRTAIWYTFVSMTSTGYGDVVPASSSGRLIGIVAMVGGIIIFSLITAIISSAYVSKLNRDKRNDLESKIDYLTSEVEKLNEKIDEMNKR
ncbi:potassium channel family protein [Methanobrevibacter sp.]|uniref:potassium channel family protein n=1 Tax=Methanobrevibacter sp. TaxID=66852 RepID=UPI00386309D7